MPLALLGLVIAAAVWLLDARTTTVMIVVRHAELEQRDTSTPPANPPLSAPLGAAGQQRAQRLRDFLVQAKPDRGVDAVFVSEDSASQQTAAPLAQSMGLAVNVVGAANWSGLTGEIMRNHAGEVVLVVANRSALQALLKQTAMGEFAVDEADHGSVFVISRSRLSKPTTVRLHY